MFAKKSLGQHFLNSPTALTKIVDAAHVSENDIVLEIGPGKGVLTSALLKTGARVIAVEKDHTLIPLLSDVFGTQIASGQLRIIPEDILEIPIHDIAPEASYKIVANIPYYITGLILRHFLEATHQPTSMTLLVQKEVALRIIGKEKLSERSIEKTKQSLLSISVGAYGQASYVATVPKGSFNPPPKVDSAIIHIAQISKERFTDITEEKFFKIVSTGFSQKRKKVFNNLKKISPKEEREKVFEVCQISPGARAEELSVEDWCCLAKNMK